MRLGQGQGQGQRQGQGRAAARHLEQLPHRKPVAGVEVLEVELDARLDEELLGDALEEGHAVLLRPDVAQDLHVLVVPVAEPLERVGDQLEVRHLEVLNRDEARVPQRRHDLLEVAQLAERHRGGRCEPRGAQRQAAPAPLARGPTRGCNPGNLSL